MANYRFEVRTRVDEISAGHYLPGYEGPCSVPHGHNWAFEAVIGANELVHDMVIDFRLVKQFFKQFDHTMFNDFPELVADGRRPTTERIAEYVASQVQAVLDEQPNRPVLLSLTVIETSRNQVTFYPQHG